MTSVMRYRAEEDTNGDVVPPKPHRLKPLEGEEADRSSSGDGAANSEEATTNVVPRPPDRPKSAELGQSPKTRIVKATASSAQAGVDAEDMSGASTADTGTPADGDLSPGQKKAAYRVSMDVAAASAQGSGVSMDVAAASAQGSADNSLKGINSRSARSQSVHGTKWTMQAREGSERIQSRRSMVMTPECPTPACSAREMVNFLYRKAEQKWLWKQMQGRTYCLQNSDPNATTDETDPQRRIIEVDAQEILDVVEDGDLPAMKKTKTAEEMNKASTPASRRQSVYILQADEDEPVAGNGLPGAKPNGGAQTTPAAAAEILAMRAALKDLMTAKKVDVDAVRTMLATMSTTADMESWLNTPLESGPPLVPKPVVFAISANDAPLVDLLLEYKADVLTPYDGPSMYKGWVKPGLTLVQCVVNRKGRFVGTMLADKLTLIEMSLLAAMAAQSAQAGAAKNDEDESGQKEFELVEEVVEDGVAVELDGEPVRRKSVAVKIAGGSTMRHTQGHPRDIFEISEHLGDGDRSSIWLGFHRETKAPVAIKTEQKSSMAIEAWLWEEINLMRKVEHPNIAQLYETFECEKQIYMVLELCEGGRLFDNSTPEQCAAVMKSPKLMRQTAMAVNFLHDKSIAHRDIQLDNFLLVDGSSFPEGSAKLIDFTTAKKFGPDEPLKTKICTPGYVAKEILTRKMDPYTEKVDVWSLGVVFFIMLSGTPPFAGTDDMDTLKKVKKGVFKFEPEERWTAVPEQGKQLVSAMINVKVEERLSSKDVLAHPYLANV